MPKGKNSSADTYRKPEVFVLGSIRNLTGGTLAHGHDTGFPAGKNPAGGNGSERRLKENITHVGTHPSGFGLYLFDYKPEFAFFGEGRQFGVMVEEVEPIIPAAIVRGDDGIKRVDYAMLGITRN